MTLESTTYARASNLRSPRAHIEEWSRNVVEIYLGSKGFNPIRSLSRVLTQYKREYEGRFLYELLQNGYDALSSRDDGDIVVLLDLDEGTHGVLYVANRGQPFTNKDFESICDLADSSKNPAEGIGNKGVGFKSVLHVCDLPEIYSARGRGRRRLDGYCFTFAGPEDYRRLANGDRELASKLRKDVHSAFLPMPLGDRPARVEDFARKGFATVIRLPLKSARARKVAIDRADDLLTEEVPVQLFLERLRSLKVIQIDAKRTTTHDLTRLPKTAGGRQSDPDQRYELVDLGDRGRWFVSHRRMPVSAMREAITESIAAGQIDESWSEWSEDAWVAVAVRTDGQSLSPRYYTFLPMESDARCPFYGHLHAPFMTKLARTVLNEDVELNARLLDQAAYACAHAILKFHRDAAVLPEIALVDLLAWTGQIDRVQKAYDEVWGSLTSVAVIPIEPLRDGRRRATLEDTVFAWSDSGRELFSRSRLARVAAAELVSSAIADDRLAALKEFCELAIEEDLEPSFEQQVSWAELIAKDLHRKKVDSQTWEVFYRELAQVFKDEGSHECLLGRSLLLCADGKLHAAPPSEDNDGHPLIFFPPRADDAGEDEVALKPPPMLEKSLLFLDRRLEWTRQAGRRRVRTEAFNFLESSRLVRRFETADVLDQVGRALAKGKAKKLQGEALRFVFELAKATRSVRDEQLRAVGLRVPTESDWISAGHATFSPAWGTPLAGLLVKLLSNAKASSSDLEAVGASLMLGPSAWRPAIDNVDEWRAFLERIGVRDGLWPRSVMDARQSESGASLTPERLASRFKLTATDTKRWIEAVERLPDWSPRNYPQTPYRPQGGVVVLPAQSDYRNLDADSRVLFAELVVAGLGQWGDEAMLTEWRRASNTRDPDARPWPSPIAAFLAEEQWLPVRGETPSDEHATAAPNNAWFYGGEDPPYFSPALLPASTRRPLAADGRALTRLKQLGLRDWLDANYAPQLLRHLADLVKKKAIGETAVVPFRRAYQEAWARAADLASDKFAAVAGDLPIVVEITGKPTVIPAGRTKAGQVYIVGDESSLAARLLEGSNRPILRVADVNVERIAPLVASLLQGQLTTVDKVEVTVVVGDAPFRADGSGELLCSDRRAWIGDLVSLVLETARGPSGQLGPERRRRVDDRLRRVRLVESADVEVQLDGEVMLLPARNHGVVPVVDRHNPTLVIDGGYGARGDDLDLLVRIARALCEILEIQMYADALKLALVQLRERGPATPTDEDFAQVLDIEPAQIREVRSHIDGSLESVMSALVPYIAYHEGAPQALAARDACDRAETAAELRTILNALVPNLPDLDRALAAARDADKLADFRDQMSLDYRRFNDVLRSLPEYQPMQNVAGHQNAMARYVDVHRDRIMLDLRRRYLATFRATGGLTAYVDARELRIPPDPAWLGAYDVPPDDLLEARTQAWLSEHGAVGGESPPLPDLRQAREDNRARLSNFVEAFSTRVPAWARKHSAPLPLLWAEEEPAEEAFSAAMEEGVLDFELLDDDFLFDWFERRGDWPPGMPKTRALGELKLVEEDLERASNLQERERDERLRRERVLVLDDQEISAESSAYPTIYAHVKASLREDLLKRRKVAKLAVVSDGRPTRLGAKGGGSGPARRPRTSEIQSRAIGLVGEAVAYDWLCREYPDATVSWRSGYRTVIGEPPGDDSLGYDLDVALPHNTLYFEVKATQAEDTRFTLTDNEVRRAAGCVNADLEYFIVFITDVLDAAAREIYLLPNPMAPTSAALYRALGAGREFAFALA
jgi:hypothetical protein